jgi:hypothetical protein
MNTLPCKQCLVFPICKQKVKLQYCFFPLDSIIGLKCPFLIAFMFDHNDNVYLRKKVLRYFGLNPHLGQTFGFDNESFYSICRRMLSQSYIRKIILSAYENE